MYVDIAPLLTNNPLLSRLNYDKTSSLDIKAHYNPHSSTTKWEKFKESIHTPENNVTANNMKRNLNKLVGKNVELQE